MKKILAVLVVLAMVLSLSAVAFAAENSYGVITGVEKPDSMSADQVLFGVDIADGTTISLDFRAVEGDWEGLSIRSSGVKKLFAVVPEYDDAGELTGYTTEVQNEATGIAVDEDITVVAGNDGWYTVTFTVTGSDVGLFIRFYYSDAHYTGENGYKSIVHIDNLKIGSKVCSFDATNLVTSETNAASLTFDDGTAFTMAKSSQMNWLLSIDTETVSENGGEEETEDVNDGGDEETEDVTEGTEETGVVSVAVVAVAAVVGGAVVLKKREF